MAVVSRLGWLFLLHVGLIYTRGTAGVILAGYVTALAVPLTQRS
jgi:hypothetical protein